MTNVRMSPLVWVILTLAGSALIPMPGVSQEKCESDPTLVYAPDYLSLTARAQWFADAGINLMDSMYQSVDEPTWELKNERQATQALEDRYPDHLKIRSVGGRVMVGVHLGADGEVEQAVLVESSGVSALDRSGVQVAEVMKFEPAVWKGCARSAWFVIPIMFQVRAPRGSDIFTSEFSLHSSL